MNNKSERCLVLAAGEYYQTMPDLQGLANSSLVIAADGGLDHARSYSIHPQFVIGDFDSLVDGLPTDGLDDAGGGDHTEVIGLPSQKDDPDMLSALKLGWNKGAREFHILGGLGGRPDHCIANIQLLSLLSHHGGIGFLYGDGYIVTAITDSCLSFAANDVKRSRMVGVLSHSDWSHDVSETGLKYQLNHADMDSSFVHGISNEFIQGVPASITVGTGTLLVTYPLEAPEPTVRRHHGFDGDLGPIDCRQSTQLSHIRPMEAH